MSKVSPISQLGFYATPAHACNYLPGRQAVTLFADPLFPKDSILYTTLSGYGFRRSGEHLYRPRCPGCSACIPVRIPAAEFRPNRGQRRVLARNREVRVTRRDACFVDEHFDLYQRYVNSRHAGGGMDQPTQQAYLDFLTSSWAQTSFYEFREHGRLIAVAAADHMERALSAVYTFFEPGAEQRSLGTFAILWQIEECRLRDWRWLYLGYWIRNSRKMHYKGNFRPFEYYSNGRWLAWKG